MNLVLLPEPERIVNVASVPQRSPFRYPGGKTWFIPHLRAWLSSLRRRVGTFVEPFAGGGIAALTVAMENLADLVVMSELDSNVASVWKVILGPDSTELIRRIRKFEMSRERVVEQLCKEARNETDLAFQTILRNRVQRGGILAPGASLVRNGENNRGVASRWYPETLARRIMAISAVRNRIRFMQRDAFDVLPKYLSDSNAAFFIDPPYTAGSKLAGKRLYLHSEIDHEGLFDLLRNAKGAVLLTYDDDERVRAMAKARRFYTTTILMKNTHHARMAELAITNAPFPLHGNENLRLLEKPPAPYGKKSKLRRT